MTSDRTTIAFQYARVSQVRIARPTDRLCNDNGVQGDARRWNQA